MNVKEIAKLIAITLSETEITLEQVQVAYVSGALSLIETDNTVEIRYEEFGQIG